jgi:hypothetical protein
MGKIQFSPTSTPPSKSSPWKQPILITTVESNTSLIGPTRVKLVFDDDLDAATKENNLLLGDISAKKIL